MTLEIVGAIVRWLISLVAGALVVRHVITASQAERLTQDVTTHVLLAVPVVLPIVWSIAKIIARYARAKLLVLEAANCTATGCTTTGCTANPFGR